jgi:phage terminase small subunit
MVVPILSITTGRSYDESDPLWHKPFHRMGGYLRIPTLRLAVRPFWCFPVRGSPSVLIFVSPKRRKRNDFRVSCVGEIPYRTTHFDHNDIVPQETTAPAMTNLDFLAPPYALSLPARRHFDRLAKQIYGQGRWDVISSDMLCAFAQTTVLMQECLEQILADGVMVSGARSDREKVKHPLLSVYSACLQNLVRLGKSVPLVDPAADQTGAAIDSLIDELVADVSA